MSNDFGEKIYSVTVKGRSMREFKAAVQDLYNEVFEVTANTVKGLSVTKNLDTAKPAVEEDDYVEESAISTAHLNNVHNNVVPLNSVQQNVNNVEVDSNGFRWDGRIHSSSKVRNNDGTWKKRKGVDKAVIAQVENELRGNVATQPVQQTYTPPVQPVQQPQYQAPVAQPDYSQQVQYQQPVAQPQYQAPVAPPMQQNMNQGYTVDSFVQNFPMAITDLINRKKIDQNYVQQLNAYFQVEQIWQASDAQKAQLFNTLRETGIV